ncbi:translocation/assembly module TamB domain-containing protein [Maribacter sp. X9]|uniref:translocation/assembly module TamB domain-containing protein n=1 Tax=Maribacter sp. X9 TaxID=3402159 RepID=UPI003AF380F7
MTLKRSKLIRFTKLIGKIFLGLLVFFFILVLVIRTPWAQNFIVNKITDYISDKTHTRVEVGRAYITFSGDVQLENVYLEDKKGDTLLYSKSLQADIPIYPIAFNNTLSLDNLYSDGLTARVSRGDDPDEFNFSFLMDAFTSPTDTTTTTTEPMEISLGEFDFSDWNFSYTDNYLGANMKLDLGKLTIDISEFDLEQMKFSIDEFVLENTAFSYVQTHAFPITNDTTTTTPPYIEIGDFEVNDLKVAYVSDPDGLDTNFNLGRVNLTDILADISKNRYETDDLILKNSQISVRLKDPENAQPTNTTEAPFTWPQFILAAQNLELTDNNFTYNLNDTPQNAETFDPNAFDIQRLNFEASDFTYRPENFHLKVSDFSFREPRGIRLNQLTFEVGLTNKSASLSSLSLQINQSSANADLAVSFKSLDEALKNPQNSSLSAAISNLVLEMEDVQQFVPVLRENVYVDSLANQTLTGFMNAKGNLKKVDAFTTELQWGKTTRFSANGTLSNMTEPDSLQYNLNDITLHTVQNDLNKFISSKELSISIPKTLVISGNLSGGTTWVNPDLVLKIPEGNALVDAYVNFGDTIGFDGTITADSLQLGKLLQNNQLGDLSLNVKASGAGTELSTLDAELTGTISQFQYAGYDYTKLEVSGKMDKGSGNLLATVNDPNLNMKANAKMKFGSTINSIDFTSNIIGADLQKLGFTKNNIKIAADIDANYQGSTTNYTVEADISEGIAVADNKQYQVSPIYLRAHVEDSVTDASIKSGFINGELSSNASPTRITAALKKQLEHYFTTDPLRYTATDNVKASLVLAIEPTPILSKVFLNGIQDIDSLNINANFDAKKQQLSAEVKVPKISYVGSSIDSLNAFVKGDSVDLKFSAGIADFLYEPLHLKQTYLEGSLKNKKLVMNFNSKNDTLQVMHINSELVFKKDTLSLHIDPENLVLNKKQWQIPQNNAVSFTDSYTDFNSFILSRDTQKLEISTKVPKMKADHIGIIFDNFELQTFLSFLNPDKVLAKGKVGGDFVILNPYDAAGLVADIQINDFEVLQNPLGMLTLDASSKSLSDYDFDLALKNGGADLRLTGDYTARQSTADLNMELDIQKLETKIVQGFFKEELSNPKGYLTGSLLVGGTLAEPTYSGRIRFNDVGLSLSSYKTTLNIDGQSLDVDEKKITLNNFTIVDKNQGSLTVDGKIITENLANPGFDFTIQTDKFRVMDSKKGDNELVYGIASIKADAKITGDLELPVIDGSIRIREITDLTYVVPQDQLEIQERDGVVIFVNRENPDAILTRTDGENSNSFFSGMDINTTLEIANEAQFTIVLDEKTQDKLQASGEATLNLNIDPNQDVRLSGRLTLNNGFYRTSLYNLVNREFKLKPGSSIVWSGDPYDAKMEVTAIYEIETSAAPLMSAISYGQDSGVSGRYQQAAPFLVYLNINGELMKPELSFLLDMPENAQGNFGGAVYGRIQQLNEQESELNKQVFSLLALNRFYPTTGSDGSSGGAVALARNNVNKVLSSELNSISNKLLGNSGFQLGFDLDSFDDYQTGTAQSRTQLNINASKKLFDDRLIVTAGSAVDVEGSAPAGETAAPVIGNVTIEYLLSDEGTYRLKGFRRQEYQNVIDGQLIVTGIAFIFDREFNKFSQLFSPVKKEETKEKPSEEKKKTEQSEVKN